MSDKTGLKTTDTWKRLFRPLEPSYVGLKYYKENPDEDPISPAKVLALTESELVIGLEKAVFPAKDSYQETQSKIRFLYEDNHIIHEVDGEPKFNEPCDLKGLREALSKIRNDNGDCKDLFVRYSLKEGEVGRPIIMSWYISAPQKLTYNPTRFFCYPRGHSVEFYWADKPQEEPSHEAQKHDAENCNTETSQSATEPEYKREHALSD